MSFSCPISVYLNPNLGKKFGYNAISNFMIKVYTRI